MLMHPCLYIFVCKKIGKHDLVNDYMKLNSKLIDSKEELDFSRYIHGYLIPHLQERRDRGELKIGKDFYEAYN